MRANGEEWRTRNTARGVSSSTDEILCPKLSFPAPALRVLSERKSRWMLSRGVTKCEVTWYCWVHPPHLLLRKGNQVSWGSFPSAVPSSFLAPETPPSVPLEMALVVKNSPANARDIRDVGSIPGSGRSPGEGHGNPLQYSCLQNPMDRGTWGATVHGVTKSRTWLKWLNAHIQSRDRDSPGGPVAKALHSQYVGPRFNLWSGN